MTSTIKNSTDFNLVRELYLNEDNRNIRKEVISYIDIISRGYIFIHNINRCLLCYRETDKVNSRVLLCWIDTGVYKRGENKCACSECLEKHGEIYNHVEMRDGGAIFVHKCNFGSWKYG